MKLRRGSVGGGGLKQGDRKYNVALGIHGVETRIVPALRLMALVVPHPFHDGGSVRGGARGRHDAELAAATRLGKRSHVYKIFVSALDAAGNRATIAIGVPIT